LLLVEKGLSREEAYKIVQSAAMKVWDSNTDLLSELLANQKISKLISEDELKKLFSTERLIERVDYIFERLGL
jgi:adenylosuccinate lyase